MAQKELWRLTQFDCERAFLNRPLIVSITGPVEPETLERCLNILAERHEVLRTVFMPVNGELFQQVLPQLKIFMREIDFSNYTGQLVDSGIRQLMEQEYKRCFDLSNGPLINTMLIRLGRHEWRLLITFHRLIIDTWSIDLFVRELSISYEAISSGTEPEPAHNVLSYSDFAIWENTMLEKGWFTPQLDYWHHKLKKRSPNQEIPTDFPRQATRSYSVARHSFSPGPEKHETLTGYCRQNECTPYHFFFSVFQTILYRYTGRREIVTGTLAGNRCDEQLEQVIGNFSNTLAICSEINGTESFSDILAQLKKTLSEAFMHRDIPFRLVSDAMNCDHDPSRTPVFQNLFRFIDTPESTFRAGNIQFEYDDAINGTTYLDLQLNIWINHDRVSARIIYNANLFSRHTIARIASDFTWAANHALTGDSAPVGAWELPSEPGIVHAGHSPDPDLNSCCNHLVEIQALANPDRVALIHGNRQLTYRELDEQANRIADHLTNRGISTDTPVGLFMNRSPEMCIAILGILKAGGAYVPLDPTYPEERLRFMISDSGLKIVLTNHATTESVRCPGLVEPLVIDQLQEIPAKKLSPQQPHSGNLAYIMYTSGSTGVPKGVMVTHGNVLNFALSALSRYGITASDRILQFFSVSFDGSIEEIFSTWAAGATLVLRDFPVELTAVEFFRQIRKNGISVIDLPTAFWHELVNSIRSDDILLPPSLRLVIIGGEQASLPTYRKWHDLFGSTPRLINTYGPTETTVVSLAADLSTIEQLDERHGGLPIGTPLDNTCIAVVSETLNIMPYGMPGELLIGGSGVTKGYLKRPELTQEKFIDGLSGKAMRFYRTGDLVRFLEDGNLLFLGRVDHQIKIRGFRIEPTGIETQLNRHAMVKSSAVIDYKDNAGQSYLVAYILPEQTAPTANELKRYLSRKMPEYMVPPHYICLDVFPLLPNGKIDRKGFPPPDLTTRQERKIIPPSTELESRLIEIWEDTLGVSPVGIRDNFFDIGGHSLMAVRLCASINERLETSLTISGLFQNLTIEALARQIQKNRPPDNLQASVLMQPGTSSGSLPALFFVHVLGTGLKFCRPMVSHLGSELPVYALSVQLLQESPLKENTIEELASFYIQEIRKISPEGPYLLAGISFGGMVIFEMARQLTASDNDVRLVALMDTIPPWAYTKLDSPERLRKHGHRLREEGISYITRKIRERLTHEFETITTNLKNLQDQLKFRYYLKTERPEQMPVEVKEFAAREENDQACARYTPAPYKGKVTLFRSLEHTGGISVVTAPDHGWSRFAHGGVEIIDCPSDHLGMLSEPYVRTVAEHLSQCIMKSVVQEQEIPKPERFTIRSIRAGEGLLLKSISIRSVQESPDAFVITLDEINSNPESYWDSLADFIATSKQDEIFLLFDDNQCIGYSGGHIDKQKPDIGHLRWMWVDPSLRGHGLGSMLIKKIVDWAKQKGVREMELWVSETQQAAIGAYQSNGFRVTGEREPVRPGSGTMSEKMIRTIAPETRDKK
jgi:aspartate racemase